MKIDNSVKNVGAPQPAETALRATRSDPQAAAVGSASVKLSASLGAAEGKGASNGAFDAERVAEIKLAIAEGRFKVDPEKIADGLLQTVRDLIRNR